MTLPIIIVFRIEFGLKINGIPATMQYRYITWKIPLPCSDDIRYPCIPR
jgi:hypothetical protein